MSDNNDRRAPRSDDDDDNDTGMYSGPERRTSDANIAWISSELTHIKDDVRAIKDDLSNRYVSYKEFMPVRAVAFGWVGLVLVAVVTTWLTSLLQAH